MLELTTKKEKRKGVHEMGELMVNLGERSYRIVIGHNMLDTIGEQINPNRYSPKTALVTNPTVYRLYGSKVKDSLQKVGFEVTEVIIPDGEEYKDFAWAYYILSRMLSAGLDRKSVVFALGGGVVGDITGFAASVYMRGIAYVQIPTTLLSQVDSSVGGKTGVNHPLGKNMIGTFYQPVLVWIDVDTLKTLPHREFLAGMAEVIKYGVIWDREFFYFLKRNREKILSQEPDVLEQMIKRCCEIKAEVVSRDEREAGLRAILNYGHTIGHAIETLTGYTRYLHGEAVSMGMLLEAELARLEGLLSKEEVEELRELLQGYGMPVAPENRLSPEEMIKAMQIDKKAVAGKMRFVLPEEIGRVKITSEVKRDTVLKVLDKQ